jgi:hypothetical protein
MLKGKGPWTKHEMNEDTLCICAGKGIAASELYSCLASDVHVWIFYFEKSDMSDLLRFW